jgi:hypothetical protein
MFVSSKLVLTMATAAVALGMAAVGLAQVPAPAPTPFPGSTAESPTASPPSAAVPSATPLETGPPVRPSIARVVKSSGILPNDHGQVWREYDISPFTLRPNNASRPEQAIVDWILRQTGYEAWHSEPLGILSATHTTLRVYHTPEMQAVVSELVDRFVNPPAQTQMFNMRVVSMGSPSWRAKFVKIMHALPVQSQGIQAWLLTREDASLLFADLRKRSDAREFSSPNALVANGQSIVVSTMHPHGYTGAVTLHPEQIHPGFEPQVMQFNEGFSLEFNPLLSLDGRSVDAMIHCDIDQLERTVTASVDVPTPIAPRQHTEIEIPQTSSYRLRELFHWPANQVLMISFGIVAAPIASESPIHFSLGSGPPRAELLAFIEDRGTAPNPLAGTIPAGAAPVVTLPGTAPMTVLPAVPPAIEPLTDRRSASSAGK